MTRFLMISASIIVLSACTTQNKNADNFATQLQAKGSEYSQIADSWKKGDELIAEGKSLVERGEDDISRGEKLLKKGNKELKKGESLIRRGQTLKQNAESSYEAIKRPTL
ncbi:MAG: hypothetical protein GW778_02965 [Alphaproteobacteria bacterium]|nr:hypothetical protein [Alphaproteobacteria bacterium]